MIGPTNAVIGNATPPPPPLKSSKLKIADRSGSVVYVNGKSVGTTYFWLEIDLYIGDTVTIAADGFIYELPATTGFSNFHRISGNEIGGEVNSAECTIDAITIY